MASIQARKTSENQQLSWIPSKATKTLSVITTQIKVHVQIHINFAGAFVLVIETYLNIVLH